MLEVPLHTGLEHPHLAWIALPGIVSFTGGLIGADSPGDRYPGSATPEPWNRRAPAITGLVAKGAPRRSAVACLQSK